MLEHILQEIWSLFMKIISTVHKVLFFKITDLYTLDKNIWKKTLSSYESKNKLSEYHQLNIPCEFAILPDVYILWSPQ